MTDQQKKLIVRLGPLDEFREKLMDKVASLLNGEVTRANATYAPKTDLPTLATEAAVRSIVTSYENS